MVLAIASGLTFMVPVLASDVSRQEKLNGGYYLLHELGNDEGQLPLLLDLKHAPAEVVTFGDRISRTGKETEAFIEQCHDRDPNLRYDRNPLPPIEQDVRDSIRADKQHQLLFGTKDSEFIRALCVSQIEASAYALNLCKVLADEETSAVRTRKLRVLSAKWLARREEAFAILREH